MTKTHPRFTVFTPCYNSARHLHRPFESLQKQTFTDFEWLVVDDGSTDETHSILERFKKQANFPVRIFRNEKNRHLAYSCNLAEANANGELYVRIDSDDAMDENALEMFDKIWNQNVNEKIAGIWCHVRNQEGRQIGIPFPNYVSVDNYFAFLFDYLFGAEKFSCHATRVLREFPFNTDGPRYVLESMRWKEIAHNYDLIFLNETLRTYFIEAENSQALTKASRSANAEITFLEYEDWINNCLSKTRCGLYRYLRFHFAFCFYAALAGKNLVKSVCGLKHFKNRILSICLCPFAVVGVVIFRALGRT